jgi:hypothetical protein
MFQQSPLKHVGKPLPVKSSGKAAGQRLWHLGRIASAHLERGRPARCQHGKDDAVTSFQPRDHGPKHAEDRVASQRAGRYVLCSMLSYNEAARPQSLRLCHSGSCIRSSPATVGNPLRRGGHACQEPHHYRVSIGHR